MAQTNVFFTGTDKSTLALGLSDNVWIVSAP